MTTTPDPLVATTPTGPDQDYDSLRAEAVARLAEVSPSWTDHNVTDPGITLMEVSAWGLADAHYRAGVRGLDAWPLTRTPAEPHLGYPSLTAGVSEVLSRPGPDGRPLAWTLARDVEGAGSRREALQLVIDAAAGAGLTITPVVGHACVRLLRRDLVRRAVLDLSAVVAATVEEAALRLGRVPPDGGGVVDAADIDAAATALLLTEPALAGLWPDEVAQVVSRERERLDLARIAVLADDFRAAADQAGLDALATLLTDGPPWAVDPAGAAQAQALAVRPRDIPPEHWENDDGDTRVWPPTPDQALRCEPVTAEDYAARARAVEGVRRAWAVPGTIAGIAWHGGPTVVTDRAGTVTLLVERAPGVLTQLTDEELLGKVVADVLGEADAPWSALGHRRVLGDEVGAALVRHHPIQVAAVLHCPAGTDPGAVVTAARQRVADYLAAGRPRPRVGPGVEPGVEYDSPARGPWPDRPQPADGWQPGEPIPAAELVQVLAADPLVAGVSGLRVTVRDGPVLREGVAVVATTPVAASGVGTVDGVPLAAGDRVLLAGQADGAANGVYVVGPSAWERSGDLAGADAQIGSVVIVRQGTHAGEVWEQTSDAPVKLGTSQLDWRRTDRQVLQPVRVALTTPVTTTGQLRLDGVRLFAGDRVLLVAQSDPAGNGVWVVTAGPWTRADQDAGPGGVLTVAEGSLAGSTWRLTTLPGVPAGTTGLGWTRTGTPQPPDGAPTGYVAVPAGGVPVLSDADCLVVRLAWTEVDDA